MAETGKINKGFARRSEWIERQKPGIKAALRGMPNYGPKSEDFRPSLKKLIFRLFGSEAEPYAEPFHKSKEGSVPKA